ncbi:ABC transporter permease [Alkalicoccus daliensis]|uniref:ABC-2 type transport system permease protein n=1 Tax=Alkalicoccus daliensis TaxID=745820 RepID=A0A1H0DS37_9BACI|nr:ABC transporter permease [Alkalicoccus daliensis]SDN72972.1 ABC-2 type transport system permease protein [Alkalicoccus daliensis]
MRLFIWKDLIVILRDRSEIMVLLLMPFILIGILGFALGGILGGDSSEIDVQVALVAEDNTEEGTAQFLQELEEIELPDELHEEIAETARTLNPAKLLKEFLENEDLKEIVTVEEMKASEASRMLEAGELDAVLTLPEGFTYTSLQAMIWNEEISADVIVTLSENGSLYANIFADLIEGFVEVLNLESAIASAAGPEAAREGEPAETGGVIPIAQNEPVNSMQYYSIGMAVMFVLYVAGTIASKAYVEKHEQVYNRIILSGTHPAKYLSGKWMTGTLFSFLQMGILFTLSAFIFRTFSLDSINFWTGMVFITFVLALCIGSLTSLLTSISIRFESDAVSSIFSGGVVTLFAFAGGSFFPLAGMPQVIVEAGNWTPNGIAMTAYLLWLQGFEWTVLLPSLNRLLLLSAVLLAASVIIFPRRRSVTS